MMLDIIIEPIPSFCMMITHYELISSLRMMIAPKMHCRWLWTGYYIRPTHNATHCKTVLGPENISDATLWVSHNDAGILCDWYNNIVNSWVCHMMLDYYRTDTIFLHDDNSKMLVDGYELVIILGLFTMWKSQTWFHEFLITMLDYYEIDIIPSHDDKF
jgi:hypothetical protein